MKTSHLIILSLAVLTSRAHAATVFSRVPDATGHVIQSSKYAPDGWDGDNYAYDDFTLTSSATITEVQWRGSSTSLTQGFVITFFGSLAGGSQPLCGYPDLGDTPFIRKHTINGTCNPVPAANGLYDFHYTLPTALVLQGNTKYWLRIMTNQISTAQWGQATSAAGDSVYFQYSAGLGNFRFMGGNLAFTLIGTFPSTGVSGTVSLGDWVAPRTGVPVTAEFLDASMTVVDTQNTALSSTGAYSVATSQTGSLRVRLSSPHFLTKALGPVTLSGNAVTGMNAALTNGDTDGTGEVDAADIDQVIFNFGSAAPSSDLDGSGEVDAADIDIAILNFGAVNS